MPYFSRFQLPFDPLLLLFLVLCQEYLFSFKFIFCFVTEFFNVVHFIEHYTGEKHYGYQLQQQNEQNKFLTSEIYYNSKHIMEYNCLVGKKSSSATKDKRNV